MNKYALFALLLSAPALAAALEEASVFERSKPHMERFFGKVLAERQSQTDEVKTMQAAPESPPPKKPAAKKKKAPPASEE